MTDDNQRPQSDSPFARPRRAAEPDVPAAAESTAHDAPRHQPRRQQDTGRQDTQQPTNRQDAARDAVEEEPKRLLGHRYELRGVIGRGGMAEVHRAYDTRLGRPVAVKELRPDLATDPTFQARFRREAQSAAGLNHPNIVAVYDTGEELDPVSGLSIPYIVMELVEGHTLRDVLRDGRKILPERALEIAVGVLDALSYSHKAGIIHRDIKPANVMLTPQGNVKVMDFGIARAVSDTQATMTQTAAVIGTAQYLSPEQARGETVDVRSDIYSAGCLLYELLVGRPPFVGDSPVSVAYQHVREMPVPPSQLDPMITPGIDALLLKALTKDAGERYQSAWDMREDIGRLLSGQEPTAQFPVAVAADPQPTAVVPQQPAAAPDEIIEEPPAEREPRRRGLPVLLTVLALALVAAGIGLFWWWNQNNPTPNTPTQVAVPRVVGEGRDSAEQRITDAQLVPRTTEVNGPTGDTVGEVTDQNPAASVMVAPGSEVQLQVNVGPKQTAIPGGLVGNNVDRARQRLNDAGFTNIQVRAAGRETGNPDPGTVLQVTPSEGTQTALSSQVTLYVATGRSQLPDWTGMTRAEVQREASSAGFTNVSFEETDTPDAAQAGLVLRTDPNAGATVERDARITVYLGRAQPTPEPTPSATESATPSQTPSQTRSPSPTSSPSGTQE